MKKMSRNTIEEAIETTNRIINETHWGKETAVEKILKFLYDELNELEKGISNKDKDNVLEEVADVNMMLICFCCKLAETDINAVNQMFAEPASNVNQSIERLNSTKELYSITLKNYEQLLSAVNNKASNSSEIYEIIQTIFAATLKLAYLMNNQDSSTTVTVLSSISMKLKRRYYLYFMEGSVTTAISKEFEEQFWNFVKNIEKVPTFFNYFNSVRKKDE